MKYSAEIREAALQKLCAPYKPSLSCVAREFGINPDTLRKWQKFGHQKLEDRMSQPMRQQDWSLEKRFEIVIQTGNMSDEALGAYCRQMGIHSNTIALWRENCINVIRRRNEVDTEKETLKLELKETKRDLRRKEKALAEASARLMLQKKAKEIWGITEAEDEDDI